MRVELSTDREELMLFHFETEASKAEKGVTRAGMTRGVMIMPNTKVVAKRNPPKKSASIRILDEAPKPRAQAGAAGATGEEHRARSIFASSTGQNGLTANQASSSRPSVR